MTRAVSSSQYDELIEEASRYIPPGEEEDTLLFLDALMKPREFEQQMEFDAMLAHGAHKNHLIASPAKRTTTAAVVVAAAVAGAEDTTMAIVIEPMPLEAPVVVFVAAAVVEVAAAAQERADVIFLGDMVDLTYNKPVDLTLPDFVDLTILQPEVIVMVVVN